MANKRVSCAVDELLKDIRSIVCDEVQTHVEDGVIHLKEHMPSETTCYGPGDCSEAVECMDKWGQHLSAKLDLILAELRKRPT